MPCSPAEHSSSPDAGFKDSMSSAGQIVQQAASPYFNPNRSRAARQGHHSLPPAEFVEAEERLVDAARGFENLARRFMRCQPDHGDAPFRESTAAIERCCA